MTLLREVLYTPWLCRLGWHRWHCGMDVHPLAQELASVLSHGGCYWAPVHVHVCRRCRRLKLEGIAPPPERLLEGRKS